MAFVILEKGNNKLYFKQELLGDFLNITMTIIFYRLSGLEGIGLADILTFTISGVYIYLILNKKFGFSIRKDALKIILVSIFIGLLNCLVVFFMDSPFTYLILGILCSLSVFIHTRRWTKESIFLRFMRKSEIGLYVIKVEFYLSLLDI